MKKWIALPAAVCFGIALGIYGCADLKKDLPTSIPAGVAVHPAGWNDTLSSDFHGNVLKQTHYDLDKCVFCHSRTFNGGTSGVACYTCHASFPHKPEWSADTSSAGFHGKFLRSGKGKMADCARCHGNSFEGGTSSVSCYQCHASYPHKTGWNDVTTLNAHGKYLKTKQWQLTECAACHGTAFNGGSSGISCYTCHVSYPHSIPFAATGGHPAYVRGRSYPLAECQTCHGTSYAGGAVANVSCSRLGCHVDRNGVAKTPEACNTCHGVFSAPASDLLSSAPPKTVTGDTATTLRGVGAHQRHLLTGTVGKSLKCQECHRLPSQAFSPGHIDSPLPAEVAFLDTLAGLATADRTYKPSPSYDGATGKCNNTFCHGNWRLRRATSPIPKPEFFYADSVMSGANYSAAWTRGAPDAACGTCHALPPTGHRVFALSECYKCHGEVMNSEGAIINKSKHINGKINVDGTERSF